MRLQQGQPITPEHDKDLFPTNGCPTITPVIFCTASKLAMDQKPESFPNHQMKTLCTSRLKA
jgi:hypothetical protein